MKQFLPAAICVSFGLSVLLLVGASSNKLNLQQQSNGIAVYVDNQLVGNAVSLEFLSGNGVLQACVPSGSQVNCTPGYNTALILSKQTLQSGSATRCVSTNGTTAFACGLNPTGTLATIVPGTELQFLNDVPCSTSQFCSLNVDNTGQLNIRANDGANNAVAFSVGIHRVAVDSISGTLIWRLLY